VDILLLLLLTGCGGGNSTPPPAPGNPVPTINSASPTTISAGPSATSITVSGMDFVSGAVVNLDSIQLTTQFVSSTQLTASVSPSTQVIAGPHAITVTNPSPGGGRSVASLQLTIVPTLAAVTPNEATVGSKISVALYGGDVNSASNN